MVGPELQKSRRQLWLVGPSACAARTPLGSQNAIRNSTPARSAHPRQQMGLFRATYQPNYSQPQATPSSSPLSLPGLCSSKASLPQSQLRRPEASCQLSPPHRRPSLIHMTSPLHTHVPTHALWRYHSWEGRKKSHVLTSRWCTLPKVTELNSHRTGI